MPKASSESGFTTKFEKWARRTVPAPAVFEVKYSKTDTMPYSAIRTHQKAWLLASMGERGVTWKIPDAGIAHKPFDVLMVGFMDAYVVIKFKSGYVVVGADTFFEHEEKSKRASITYPEAKKIATWSGDSL
jgi:hypothetical protein